MTLRAEETRAMKRSYKSRREQSATLATSVYLRIPTSKFHLMRTIGLYMYVVVLSASHALHETGAVVSASRYFFQCLVCLSS